MMEGENIVCISNTTWFGEYTKSTVQLMSLLAQKNKLVFVEYPFTLKDVVTTIFGKQKAPVARMLGLKKRLKCLEVNGQTKLYHLVSPPVLPVDFIQNDKLFDFLFRINIFFYQRQIKKTLQQLNLKNPIVVTAYNPFFGLPLIGTLQEKLNIYYCYDGIGTRRHGQRIFSVDRKFSQSVDAIVTTLYLVFRILQILLNESYKFCKILQFIFSG